MPISRPVLCGFVLFMFSLIPISLARLAQAQIPKGDICLGYSRTGTDAFYSNVGGLNGWESALHIKLHKPFIGIEGDVSHYGLGANSTVPEQPHLSSVRGSRLALWDPRSSCMPWLAGSTRPTAGDPSPKLPSRTH